MEMTECRKAFEEWAASTGAGLERTGILYADERTQVHWQGWRAAWSARQMLDAAQPDEEELLHIATSAFSQHQPKEWDFTEDAVQAVIDAIRPYLSRPVREISPLTGDERHALVVEIIGAVDGLLARDVVVGRDFLRYWQAYSGDIAKRILSALLERFEVRRRGSDHE